MPKNFSGAAAVTAAAPAPHAPQEIAGIPHRTPGGPAVARLPRLRVEPDFWLCAHSTNWDVATIDGQVYWVPDLRKVPIIAGLNGIRQQAGGRGLDTSHTRTRMQDLGWIFLPEDPPYKRRIQAQAGVTVVDTWTRVIAYPDGVTDVSFDHAGWDLFRAGLVARGIVPPIRPGVVAQLRRRVEKRIGRRIDQIHKPSVQAVVAAAEQRLAALDAAQSVAAEVLGMTPTPYGAEVERDRALKEAAMLRAELQRLQGEEDV